MNALEGKVTLVTGAKGGLGSFVTEAFLAAGAKVVGVSRSIQASDFSHPEFTAMAAELSSGEAARRLAEEVVASFGRIDALVHVMGGFAGGKSVAETDDATFEKMLDLNFRAAFFIARAVLPQMRQQGAAGSSQSRVARPSNRQRWWVPIAPLRLRWLHSFEQSPWRTKIDASRPTLCCRARWTLPEIVPAIPRRTARNGYSRRRWRIC